MKLSVGKGIDSYITSLEKLNLASAGQIKMASSAQSDIVNSSIRKKERPKKDGKVRIRNSDSISRKLKDSCRNEISMKVHFFLMKEILLQVLTGKT